MGSAADQDGDGVPDLVDWNGIGSSVQAQYDIWAYQDAGPSLTVGKIAAASGTGIDVTLTSRNLGSSDGEGLITDTIPTGWTLAGVPSECAQSGATLSCTVDVAGSEGSATFNLEQITYVITPDSGSDTPYLELDPAHISFSDGSSTQMGSSLPAAVYMADTDGDGTMECGSPEVCDGIDNDEDGRVDEGFDSDGDGVADCFDTEVCDGVDNDGDGSIDEGLDCGTDDCPSIDPGTCVEVWQAEARGWLSVTSGSGGATVTMMNLGPDPVCLDDQVFFTSDGTQPFFQGDDVDGTTLATGGSITLAYGSWTTDNGVYAPYSGSDPWWCVNDDRYFAGGATFDYYGEGIPAAIAALVGGSADVDGDGVEDLVDWNGFGSSVQAQADIWAYQDASASLTIGKTAAARGAGIAVTLTSRNLGSLDGTGTITDTVPVGWTLSSVPSGCTASGSSLTCAVSVAGTEGSATFSMAQITYTITRDNGADTPYLELDPATIAFSDGTTDQVGSSLPAAVYMADTNGDGDVECAVACPEEEPSGCLSLYEAYSQGVLSARSNDAGDGVTLSNSGSVPVCIDEQVMFTNDTTQAFFPDDALIADDVQIGAGSSVTLYYASWTTDNGTYEPYAGQYGWWCVEEGQYVSGDQPFDFYGEIAPDALLAYADDATDVDGDEVEDSVDWAGPYGVQANYNIWNAQATSAQLMVGKRASVSGQDVSVSLIVRNIGLLSTTGAVSDTLPAGWELVSADSTPTTSTDASGNTVLGWTVSMDGYAVGGSTAATTTLSAQTLTYTIRRTNSHDTPRVELPAASVYYWDHSAFQTTSSMPWVVYDYDGNGDGVVECDE